MGLFYFIKNFTNSWSGSHRERGLYLDCGTLIKRNVINSLREVQFSVMLNRTLIETCRDQPYTGCGCFSINHPLNDEGYNTLDHRMTNPTLNYDRQTVNLAFELKRSLPLTEQASFKLSDPNLVELVREIYRLSSKEQTKQLAQEFLQKVGVSTASSKGKLLGAFKN